MKAISVRQPWAWLLLHGKDVENRDWFTGYRGPLAIHASSGMSRQEFEDARDFVRRIAPQLARRMPPQDALVMGAVIGTVRQVGCVRESKSPWFSGAFGHVYTDARELAEPVWVPGHLGLWEWAAPAEGLRYVEELHAVR